MLHSTKSIKDIKMVNYRARGVAQKYSTHLVHEALGATISKVLSRKNKRVKSITKG